MTQEQPVNPSESNEHIEQKRFPTKTEIIGGTLPPDGRRLEAVVYEGGTIEIKNDGIIEFAGFGLDKPSQFGSIEDITDPMYFKKTSDYTYRKTHPLPDIPMYDEHPTECNPENTKDLINLKFYVSSGSSIPIDINESHINQDKELQDKFLILSNTLKKLDVDGMEEFIKLRPDLATEMFSYACRSFILFGTHSEYEPLITYLISHTDMLSVFPDEYKPHLAVMIINKIEPRILDLMRGRRTKDEKLEKLELIRSEIEVTSEKLGIDMSNPYIKARYQAVYDRIQNAKDGI